MASNSNWRLATLTCALALAGCGSTEPEQSGPALYLYHPTAQGWKLENQLTYQGEGKYRTQVDLGKGDFQFRISDTGFTCGTNFGAGEDNRLLLNKPMTAKNCASKRNFQIKVAKSGQYVIELDAHGQMPIVQVSEAKAEPAQNAPQATTTQVVVAEAQTATEAPLLPSCGEWDGQAVTVDVAGSFAEGELIRDFYSGQTATVTGGQVTLTPAQDSEGLLLLESAEHQATDFSWDNATVYFVITDRFHNGDPSNDNSYGRSKDGEDEIGTFHGGDLKGLTAKLDYIAELGVNAIWLTAPYEQIHGWMGGGIRGDFKHYAYHGYYVQDYTRIDKNMGSEDDFRTFIDAAHERGIRVVMDVVMNHTGYATLADMQQLNFGALQEFDQPIEEILGVENWTDWQPGAGETWHSFNNFIDYGNDKWVDWWSRDWIRTDIAGYTKPGRNNLTMMLAYLPDFKTESKKVVELPPFLLNKADSRVEKIEGYTVRNYLVKWLTDWVRDYGIDGFRVDTAKHVELDAWMELKQAGTEALAEWKRNNPDKALDDEPFWMTGEFWGHDVSKSQNFEKGGFDSVINFTYQNKDAVNAMGCFADAETTFSSYASKINSDPDFNVLSYISSHDTKLYFHRNAKGSIEEHKRVAAPFLLLPGGVQIFYGDETARPYGPTGSDKHQGTRSDMNWADIGTDEARTAMLAHWQKLGQFRDRHQAVGAGTHTKLSDAPYAFKRELGDDKVVVVFAGHQSK